MQQQTGQCENRCFGNRVLCGETCIDPQTNHAFCGASDDCRGDRIGKECDEGMVCSRGECRSSCDDALVNCGGDCIDPQTDGEHCGATATADGEDDGDVCQGGTSCVKGKCRGASVSEGTAGKPEQVHGRYARDRLRRRRLHVQRARFDAGHGAERSSRRA